MSSRRRLCVPLSEVRLFCLPALHLQDSYSYVRSTAPAVAYDSKQYYQQPSASAAVAAAQPQPSVAESYYQTGALASPWDSTWKKSLQGPYFDIVLLTCSSFCVRHFLLRCFLVDNFCLVCLKKKLNVCVPDSLVRLSLFA